MGLFKRKRRVDVVDLTRLQKMGVVSGKRESEPVTSTYSSDSTSDSGDSALGFLGNLASASSGSESSESSSSYNTTNSSYSSSDTDSSGYLDYSQRKARLRTRILEMQEKVNKHGDELYDIKNLMEVLQKRLERLERKSGIREDRY